MLEVESRFYLRWEGSREALLARGANMADKNGTATFLPKQKPEEGEKASGKRAQAR